MMSSEDISAAVAAGSAASSSSRCASTNSTASSSSNYNPNFDALSTNSTVENGDLSVFTFIIPNPRNEALNGRMEFSPCSCTTFQGPCSSPHLNSSKKIAYHGGFSMEPFSPEGHFYCNGGRKRSPILSDNYYMRLLPRNGDSLLLKSMERGVLFPVVHWSSKYNENLTQTTQFGSSATLNQGIYRELKRVIPPDVWLHREMSGISRKPTWLIIGYKSLEKTLDSSLEATWKEWTGVRHIYLNLRHDFEIQKISFLHRVHPRDNLDLFMYIVLMEIGNVHEKNTIWLLDFVQRMRMERMKGFLTVYSEVEQEISLIDDEYFKYFNEEQNARNKKTVETPTTATATPLSSPTSSTISSPSGGSSASGGGFGSSSSSGPSISINTSMNASRNILTGQDHLTIVDHASEINGNLKMIEKILEEMGQQPIGDYF